MIFHFLDLVGQPDESPIDFVERAAIELMTQLFAPDAQSVTARVFTQHQLRSGTPTDCGVIIS